MSLAVVVVGNGRTDYLRLAVSAALEYLPPVDHYLMVDDSGDARVAELLDGLYGNWTIRHHSENRGMAAAVQSGFDLVLDTSTLFAVWIEEDMLLTDRLPLGWAMTVLQQNPHVAQMCFRRDPVAGNPFEAYHGDQLRAITEQASFVQEHERWTEHDFIFSLNPCLIPRRTIELGWDTGNEAGMTAKLKGLGQRFGSWGHAADGQSWARHIGEQRAAQWQL